MKVDSNKVICSEFGRKFLDGYIDYHDELPLGDLSMNLLPHHLQELTCLSRDLLHMEFIICLIEGACSSPLLPNLDPLL